MPDITPEPSGTDAELQAEIEHAIRFCYSSELETDIQKSANRVMALIQADRERLYGELETRLTKASYSSSREGRIVNLIVGLQVLNKVFNREGADNE